MLIVVTVVQDAEKALDYGVNGIIVSNHGERMVLIYSTSPSAQRGLYLTMTVCPPLSTSLPPCERLAWNLAWTLRDRWTSSRRCYSFAICSREYRQIPQNQRSPEDRETVDPF